MWFYFKHFSLNCILLLSLCFVIQTNLKKASSESDLAAPIPADHDDSEFARAFRRIRRPSVEEEGQGDNAVKSSGNDGGMENFNSILVLYQIFFQQSVSYDTCSFIFECQFLYFFNVCIISMKTTTCSLFLHSM